MDTAYPSYLSIIAYLSPIYIYLPLYRYIYIGVDIYMVLYSADETYNFKEPTNRSHVILQLCFVFVLYCVLVSLL